MKSTADGRSSPVRDGNLRFLPLFIGVSFLLYFKALHFGFIWDDDFYLFKNPLLDGLAGLKDIWLSHKTVQYYPIVFSSFWIEKRFWGLNPIGYHAVNLLLHGINGYLVFRCVARLHKPAAFLTGLIFVVHPLQAETVCWITERKNLLCLFFFLLSLLSCMQFLDGRNNKFYLRALLFFCFGLLSKSIVVSFAAVPLLLSWAYERNLGRRDGWLTAPFAVIGAAAGWHTAYLESHRVGAMGAEWARGIVERTLLAGSIIWFYVYKTIFPWRLSFIYPKWAVTSTEPLLWVSLALLIACAAGIYSLRRNFSRVWLAAAVFFIISIFPALGFVNLYPMRYSHVQDHFLYLSMPSLIACLIVAPWLWISGRTKPDSAGGRFLKYFPWIIVVLFGFLSFSHAQVFLNAETLWNDTLEKNPSAWIAANNLGTISVERQDWATAELRFERAVQIDPESYEAHNNLGFVLHKQGRLQEARAHFETALRIRPDYADAYYNLAVNSQELGHPDDEVETLLTKTVQLDAQYWEALNALGILYLNRGKLDLSERYFKEAASAVDGKRYEPFQNLSVVYAKKGDSVRSQAMMGLATELKH